MRELMMQDTILALRGVEERYAIDRSQATQGKGKGKGKGSVVFEATAKL